MSNRMKRTREAWNIFRLLLFLVREKTSRSVASSGGRRAASVAFVSLFQRKVKTYYQGHDGSANCQIMGKNESAAQKLLAAKNYRHQQHTDAHPSSSLRTIIAPGDFLITAIVS